MTLIPDAAGGQAPTESAEPESKLYADVAGLLSGGLPDPPEPLLLRRTDGRAIFYAAQVNLVFGDPESGKSLVSQAAAAEALIAGRRVLLIDLDHNGILATICRFIDFGVPEHMLADLDRFRYVEPEDRAHLAAVIEDARSWRPAVAVVDSIGELLPTLGLNSNSPDDFTLAHTRILKPLALAGAAVLAIDHLPKNTEARSSGPTGTTAKRRAIGGVSIRVTVKDQFVPGHGGSAYLSVNKDRHGGLRKHCPNEGKEPSAGLFVLDSRHDALSWSVRAPQLGDSAEIAHVSLDDLAVLDALDPPPSTVRDVKARLNWRTDRAADVLREWRSRRSRGVPGERGTPLTVDVPRSPTPAVGNGEHDTCSVCGQRMIVVEVGQTTHPGCSVDEPRWAS